LGYIDARNTSVERLVWLIAQKLEATPGITTSRPPLLRSPRTLDQKRELLAERPEAWEYLLYAGVLWQGCQDLEAKWRDHELGYARRTGQHLDEREALRHISGAMDDFKACMANLLKMLDSQARELAFGPPGQPGDAMLIEHLATRFIEVYEEILDIAARLRGARVSDNMTSVMDAAAHLADNPLKQIRDFIDQIVVETDAIPDRLALDEPITITLTLTLSIDDEAQKRIDLELDRAKKMLEAES